MVLLNKNRIVTKCKQLLEMPQEMIFDPYDDFQEMNKLKTGRDKKLNLGLHLKANKLKPNDESQSRCLF